MLRQAGDRRAWKGVYTQVYVYMHRRGIYIRGGRDMAVKERRKSVASTKGASFERNQGWRAREGGRGLGGKRRGWNPAEGGGFGRARIIFAEEQALPLFAVAGGTRNGGRRAAASKKMTDKEEAGGGGTRGPGLCRFPGI